MKEKQVIIVWVSTFVRHLVGTGMNALIMLQFFKRKKMTLVRVRDIERYFAIYYFSKRRLRVISLGVRVFLYVYRV